MPALTDPLGRLIELHDWTWWGHIVKGHPEVRNMRADAERALTAPTSIHFSSSDSSCRLYYCQGPAPGLMICVVADVVAGLVKTAYLAKRIKPGGQEWP